MKTKISLFTLAMLCVIDVSASDKCEGCSTAESTSVQLQQMLDTVKILKLIALESDELDPKTLEFYLSRYGSSQEVSALLATLSEKDKAPQTAQSVKKNSRKLKKKAPPRTPRVLTKQPKGLEGLLVSHAQSATPEIGYAASAILSSNGRGIPLGIGNRFSHNGEAYTLEAVTKYTNSDKSIGHSVSIRNTKTNEVKSLPWKLGVKK